jgi:hypothetical protein
MCNCHIHPSRKMKMKYNYKVLKYRAFEWCISHDVVERFPTVRRAVRPASSPPPHYVLVLWI